MRKKKDLKVTPAKCNVISWILEQKKNTSGKIAEIQIKSTVLVNRNVPLLVSLYFKDFIYLFLDRREEREKEREASICGCLLQDPHWGPGPQPRHVP